MSVRDHVDIIYHASLTDEEGMDMLDATRARSRRPGVHLSWADQDRLWAESAMCDWDDVVAIAGALPSTTESTSYRTPALKVRGKTFARLRTEAEGGLMLVCGLDEKAALLASGDPAFYTTAHYDGYGAILVDLAAVDRDQLVELVTEAWRCKAPATLRKEYDGGQT